MVNNFIFLVIFLTGRYGKIWIQAKLIISGDKIVILEMLSSELVDEKMAY